MEEGRNNHRKISPRPLSLHFAYCEKYEYFTSWDKDSWQVAHKSSLVSVSLPKLHKCNVAIAFPHLLCWFTQQKCMAHYFSILLFFSDIFTDRREQLWPFKWQEHIMNNLGPSPADWPLTVLQLSGTKKCIQSHCWILFYFSEGGSPELRHNLLLFPLASPSLSGILSFWSNLRLGRQFEQAWASLLAMLSHLKVEQTNQNILRVRLTPLYYLPSMLWHTRELGWKKRCDHQPFFLLKCLPCYISNSHKTWYVRKGQWAQLCAWKSQS